MPFFLTCMKYVLSKHIYLIGSFVLRSFLEKIVPICETWTLSCRSTAIPFIQGLTTPYVAAFFSCQQRQHGFVWGGGEKQHKPKKTPNSKDLCCICICSPSGLSLPEVGTPSCWNPGFGKQEWPWCPSLVASLCRSFLNWSWGRRKRDMLEASNAFMFYGLNRWLCGIPEKKKREFCNDNCDFL